MITDLGGGGIFTTGIALYSKVLFCQRKKASSSRRAAPDNRRMLHKKSDTFPSKAKGIPPHTYQAHAQILVQAHFKLLEYGYLCDSAQLPLSPCFLNYNVSLLHWLLCKRSQNRTKSFSFSTYCSLSLILYHKWESCDAQHPLLFTKELFFHLYHSLHIFSYSCANFCASQCS